jgi:protein gp37
MGDLTHIQWTTHTFNPWWGCSRVSPACRFCYADRDASRYGFELWRRHGERRMLSENNWRKPLKWNRDAEAAGIPAKVFCASMADVFEDHPQLAEPRERLWGLIEATPSLRWQLLTKRPENVASMAPWGADWPAHVWLGTSIETQRWADVRVPQLRAIPAEVRFLSAEPLLGYVNLREHLASGDIHQVIVGGESGAGAKVRPMDIAWARHLIIQCRDLGVAAFMKQTGTVYAKANGYQDRKGGDPQEWPHDLRIREYPQDAVSLGAGSVAA